MAYVKPTSQPALEAVSPAQFLEFMNLPSGFGQTETITELLAAAREEGEKLCGRALAKRTFRQVIDAFPCNRIQLFYPPAVSVQSIQYISPDGELVTLASDVYLLDKVSEPAIISLAAGGAWPQTRHMPSAVTINFTAGYDPAASDDTAVPYNLKTGIKNLAAYWFQNRGANHSAAAIGKGFDVPPYIEKIFTTQQPDLFFAPTS